MTQTFSKARQQAEAAFGNAQSEFFAQGHAVEEMDYVAQAREAKTLRLREARLAKEARLQAAISGPVAKQAGKKTASR